MSLKSSMRDEARRIFLNPDEFAEEIVIDGVPALALCDWSINPEDEVPYGSSESWGISRVQAEIVIESDIIPLPEPGQELLINERDWIVRSASAQTGLLTMRLYRNIA